MTQVRRRRTRAAKRLSADGRRLWIRRLSRCRGADRSSDRCRSGARTSCRGGRRLRLSRTASRMRRLMRLRSTALPAVRTATAMPRRAPCLSLLLAVTAKNPLPVHARSSRFSKPLLRSSGNFAVTTVPAFVERISNLPPRCRIRSAIPRNPSPLQPSSVIPNFS